MFFCILFLSRLCVGYDLPHRYVHRSHKLHIKYVTIKNFHENAFKTIGEYFGDEEEHQYFRCITRDFSGRSGTYFIIGLNRSVAKLPHDGHIKLSLRIHKNDEIKIIKFPLPKCRSLMTSEVYCGITSQVINADHIQAWRIEIFDGEDEVLCHKQSYLWQ